MDVEDNLLISKIIIIAAPLNGMRAVEFGAQPTNVFFAAVNRVFGGSSKLPTAAEHCFIVWTVLNDLITACLAVIGSWEELLNI